MVLSRLETYSPDKLAGRVGAEFVGVIDNIAKRQLLLKRYTEAETSYQKALALHLRIRSFDEETSKKLSAGIYHNLGAVAQEQRQWVQAEQYYQQALQIYIESQDRHAQASTYHSLGIVAQEQRHWSQAEQYYQQALQIFKEHKDRYKQAHTYHNLGSLAQEQRQWPQAEQYYQQALQIKIEYKDRYSQASTYHNLGLVAEEQRKFQQAYDYFLIALETFAAHNDPHNGSIVWRSLARLWQASGDTSLPATIASALGIPLAQVETLLRQALGNEAEGGQTE
jgi:tetratricopeptide (TPR) repeat protein